jgi:hypothetical protein
MTLEIQIMFLLSTLDTRVKIPPMDNYAMPDSNVLRNETDKQKRDAATSLLKVSNIENQPQHGNYFKFILTI